MKRLVLVGGGHAHLAVLRAFARTRLAGVEVMMVTPSRYQHYSGMLPGWMAGHYTETQCRIDLQPLAQHACVQLVVERAVAMDADRRCLMLADGRRIEYDLISLDSGSEIDSSWLELAGPRLLVTRPLDNFFCAWTAALRVARRARDYCLVVVGGGAAGVELALAARHRLTRVSSTASVQLVVGESGLLAGHAPRVRQRVANVLASAGVTVHCMRAVGVEQGVMLSDGTLLFADHVIGATGARAPFWLTHSALTLDEDGYVGVDGYHRSVSHANVFAAGDVCTRQDLSMARSGVHAVHAGPVLARNLVATLTGGRLGTYRPRRRSLYLLACGSRYAVASWGALSLEGAWVWRWKDHIDRTFVSRSSRPGRGRDPLPVQGGG